MSTKPPTLETWYWHGPKGMVAHVSVSPSSGDRNFWALCGRLWPMQEMVEAMPGAWHRCPDCCWMRGFKEDIMEPRRTFRSCTEKTCKLAELEALGGTTGAILLMGCPVCNRVYYLRPPEKKP